MSENETRADVDELGRLAEWLANYLGNYTLPANYAAPLYGQTHREVAKYCGPVIAEDLLESDWLRDHDAALLAEVSELRATVARVRGALDDELANLADDGARLSHSVVRRIEAALGGAS